MVEEANLKINNSKIKKRESNIELLRILSMLMIISFHCVFKSGYDFYDLTFNTFLVKLFYMFGELGVNLFILITGYFMVKGKFSLKKVICLILEVEFYYIFTMILASILGIYSFNRIKDYILMFFPIILNQYWFITAYLLLYIFSPYLNKLISNLSKEDYKKFLVLGLLVWCIIPTIFGIFYNSSENVFQFSRLVWVIYIYFVGSYIRLYSLKLFEKRSNCVKCSVITFILMSISILFIFKFREFFSSIGTTEFAYFWTPNSILMFVLSVSVFGIFLNTKIKYNKVINILASTTLGVYMLHDGNFNWLIWNDLLKVSSHFDKIYAPLFIVCIAIIIYLIGTLIDLFRQRLEKVTVLKFLNSKKYSDLLDVFKSKYNNLLKKI